MNHPNPLLKLLNVIGWATRESFEWPRLASVVRDIAPEFNPTQQAHLFAAAAQFDAGEPGFALDHLKYAWSTN